jgi:DIS3-like exonuclease 2
LRHKRIFTIDPITAMDLDDALSIDKITDNIYEIGVHIADVSYFVQQGTELDLEAQLRCTSVYFVHRVYPMLPRLLCERLCSLNPQVDRLSYSIFFRLDITTGEVDKSFQPKLARTIMRSCAKWHYQLVQDILDKVITRED